MYNLTVKTLFICKAILISRQMSTNLRLEISFAYRGTVIGTNN